MLPQIYRVWNKFINPKDLEAAFVFTIICLQVAGLFPYKQGATGFELSYAAYAVTLAHFSAYLYVNGNLFLNDIMGLAKPIIMDNDLAVGANLLIRLTGIVITVAIFWPIISGTGKFTATLNRYVVLMEILDELGIDSSKIFKRMLVSSVTATVIVCLISLYLLFFSAFFYDKITNEKASLQYYYVVILTNYYKNMCLFSAGSYLFSNFLITSLLNRFLNDLLKRMIKEHATWKSQFKDIACS